jgi:SAM-dependent methyltransferase
MLRFIQDLRWRWQRFKLRDAAYSQQFTTFMPVTVERLAAVKQMVNLQPYECLAAHYLQYSRDFCPRYDEYLPSVARGFVSPVSNVLEVACGAGTLTVLLARRFKSVAGLDISPHMIASARQACRSLPNVRLFHADFRSFELHERFDAAVCATDSLNYACDVPELTAVFSRVAAHVRPGGFFLFDVLGRQAMRAGSAYVLKWERNGVCIELLGEFDVQTLRDTTYVVFANGAERHVRTPFEPPEITAASSVAGFRVLDAFLDFRYYRAFYLLQRIEQVG